MSMAEKIKIMLIKRNMSAVDLSKILDCTPTNVYNKLKRDNFSERSPAHGISTTKSLYH